MADNVPQENPRKRIRLDESVAPPHSTENSAETDLDKQMRLGITSYANAAIGGFSGILKQRYTDFLVNEILLSGKVLHLENIEENSADANRNKSSFNPISELPVILPPAEEKPEVSDLRNEV